MEVIYVTYYLDMAVAILNKRALSQLAFVVAELIATANARGVGSALVRRERNEGVKQRMQARGARSRTNVEAK